MYDYPATYVGNYDGDTIDFLVDVGFNIQHKIRVRLAGVDTAELRGGTEHSKELAREAKYFVEEALTTAGYIEIKTEKDKTGKYGRYIAHVFYDGKSLNEDLVTKGLAKRY